jgi:hypothetical protein
MALSDASGESKNKLLGAFKAALPSGVGIDKVRPDWVRWCKDRRKVIPDNVREAGLRFLDGDAAKLNMAHPQFIEFCNDRFGLSSIEEVLATPRRSPRVDQFARFEKEHMPNPLIETLCGEYVLFRQGFEAGAFVAITLNDMKPYQLRIFQTSTTSYDFSLEDGESKNRWAGNAYARKNVAFLVGWSICLEQFMAVTLAPHPTHSNILIGVQMLHIRANHGGEIRETCINRYVSCAKRDSIRVSDENKFIAQEWLDEQTRRNPNGQGIAPFSIDLFVQSHQSGEV